MDTIQDTDEFKRAVVELIKFFPTSWSDVWHELGELRELALLRLTEAGFTQCRLDLLVRFEDGGRMTERRFCYIASGRDWQNRIKGRACADAGLIEGDNRTQFAIPSGTLWQFRLTAEGELARSDFLAKKGGEALYHALYKNAPLVCIPLDPETTFAAAGVIVKPSTAPMVASQNSATMATKSTEAAVATLERDEQADVLRSLLLSHHFPKGELVEAEPLNLAAIAAKVKALPDSRLPSSSPSISRILNKIFNPKSTGGGYERYVYLLTEEPDLLRTKLVKDSWIDQTHAQFRDDLDNDLS